MSEAAFVGRSWTGRRFAIVAIALTVAALAGALLFVDGRMESITRHEAETAMSDELAALTAIARDEGADSLQDALDVRSVLGQHFYHLLVGPTGQILAGNMRAWPGAVRQDGRWTEFAFTGVDGAGKAYPAEALGIAASLPDRSRLLIANDLEAQKSVRTEALIVFAAALAGAVAAALSLGFWLDRILIARIAEFARTGDAVMAGRLDARVRIGDDRDELSVLARTMNAMLDRIEALLGGLRAVTDSLAHDLRTPLTQIASSLESGDVANARGAARRLAHTFETLIDIARAESGLSRAAMASMDVSALVADLVGLFEPAIEDKSLTHSFSATPAPCVVHPQLLRQAVGNMLDNAIKFSEPGGRIEIAVVAVSGGADIVVADRGVGIPTDQRELAMSRFGRLPRDADVPGSGLGLSIAAAAARLHGGRLLLDDNAPGLKATLEIRTNEIDLTAL